MATRALVALALGAPAAGAYKTPMARKESRQARAARAEAIFERLAAANPAPKGELKYVNPFTLLVAVVLSAQTTDAGVNKVTPALFAIADSPGEDGGARRRAACRTDQDHRALSDQGEERHRAFAGDRRAARRSDAARSSGARGAARRRAQDCECSAQHRLRRADARGRHPCLPSRQPAWHRAGQDARARSKTSLCASCRPGSYCTLITG